MVGKAGDKLKQRLGANMAESMGAGVAPAARPVAARQLPPQQVGVRRTPNGTFVRLEQIVPDPGQPRKSFPAEQHRALVESVKVHGLMQPIAVYWPEGGPGDRYMVAWGQRRYEAAIEAGLEEIPVTIVEVVDLPALREKQVVENVLRENLKDVELAAAWKELQRLYGWNDSQLARRFGVQPSTVGRILSLLDTSPEVQEMIRGGEVGQTAAFEIAKLNDPALQAEVAREVADKGLDVADTKKAVARAAGRDTGPATRPRRAGAPRGPRGKGQGRPGHEKEWGHKAANKLRVAITSGNRWFTPADRVAALEEALEHARAV